MFFIEFCWIFVKVVLIVVIVEFDFGDKYKLMMILVRGILVFGNFSFLVVWIVVIVWVVVVGFLRLIFL